MRFLVDECTGPAVARWLEGRGHAVFSVFDEAPGITDDAVLRRAYEEARVLVTNDKDFGEKVYRERRPHCGVVLLRLHDERSASKIAVLQRLLDAYGAEIEGRFVVATAEHVRFAAPRTGPGTRG
jgi:predicted nuclease of predicted toxin-antitoxin system